MTKLKIWIYFNLIGIIILLSFIIVTPLLIRHGLIFGQNIILDEKIVEVIFIVFLFGFSFFIFKELKHSMSAYEAAVDQARIEKLSLVSRLSDAFNYIGSVNLEIQEIQSILNGIDNYPQSKGEFRHIFNHLTTKAAFIAQAPWAVIRIVSKYSGRTVKEHTCQITPGCRPSFTVGNNTILKENYRRNFTIIQAYPNNNELCSVCIFPKNSLLTKEQISLLKAIVGQAEIYFLLYHSNSNDPDLAREFSFSYPPQNKIEKDMISSNDF